MPLLDWLFNPSGLTAHGFCLSWAPGLVALHAVSDGLTGLSYLSIPLALFAFARRRRDLPYGWIAYLFVAFIVACGTTHLLSIVTLWFPIYGVEGLVKLVTAILSIGTAVMLWPLIPKLMRVPGPLQLTQLNAELSELLADQRKAAASLRESEAKARLANLQLEHRVAERTAELTAANGRLVEAMAQRSAAEEAQARSEEEFRISFQSAAVGKIQADPFTGRLLRVNPAFAHMLGYEPEELVGELGSELTWPEDRLHGDLARMQTGEITVMKRELRMCHRDGHPIWVRISATIVQMKDNGEPRLLIGVIEDIDERHKAQIAFQQTSADLALALEERTAALQQRDLLLREVYHRVKNNLQIVDGLLVMQSRAISDADSRAALQGLRGRIYALGLVHHQLMDSSDLKTFDIAPFLSELSHNIVDGGPEMNITLSVEAISLKVGLDFAIPLGLLVTELVTNSLKHAFPTGAGTIKVSLDRDDGGSLVLIVQDDGQGMHSDEVRPNKLGLTIINGLIDQLQGRMSMQTSGGTRTEIRLPEAHSS
ncbi:PAS domain S-box-containing protein [Sphingomonas sp. YR710]|nr:PAS domain S-box-containing protein [Sphingomonas sp. YR710]